MKTSVGIAVLAISLCVVFVAVQAQRQQNNQWGQQNNQWGSGLERGRQQQRPDSGSGYEQRKQLQGLQQRQGQRPEQRPQQGPGSDSGLEQGRQQRPQQRPGSDSSEEQWGPGSGSNEASNGKCRCFHLLGRRSLNCSFTFRTSG